MGDVLTDTITKVITEVTRKLQLQATKNQKQTCGNFADLNTDMDDIKRLLQQTNKKLELLLDRD